MHRKFPEASSSSSAQTTAGQPGPRPGRVLAALRTGLALSIIAALLLCFRYQSTLACLLFAAPAAGLLLLLAWPKSKSPETTSKSEQETDTKELHRLFDSGELAVFVRESGTGKVVDVNSTMCRMFKCSKHQALELAAGSLSSGEAPYTADEARLRLRIAEEGEPQKFDWQCRDLEGDCFWAEIYARRIRLGDSNRLVVTVRNITAEKQAHESARRLALMQEMIADYSGRFLRCHDGKTDTLTESMLAGACTMLDLEHACVLRLSEGGSTYSITHEWTASGIRGVKDAYQEVSVEGYRWSASLLMSGQVLRIDSLDRMPPESEFLRRELAGRGAKTMLGMPIMTAQGIVSGALIVHTYSAARHWSGEDERALSLVVDLLSRVFQREDMPA